MTETPDAPRLAQTMAEVEDALLSRWPETRLEPSLDRIAAFTEVLGDPQRAYPVIHLTGTNGKTSTSRMIDTLLRALELRTGRFTSPHVERMNERISVDGEPLSDEDFVRAFNDVAPYTHLVDADQPHPLSFFETVVGMAYAAFADAPVDVAVVEVGMGGSWDATNVADATVAVVLPVAVDHAAYLGGTPAAIAVEKAGIIKPGSVAVLAQQSPEVAEVLLQRAAEVGARVVAEGVDFGVISRVPAVGGQVLSLQGLRARYDDIFLPLHGAHQAQNAAVALAAVEAFLGDESQALDGEVVGAAFAEATSPGRLEVVRRSPTIVLDAAHNPHGAEALAAALEDSFTFDPLIGVLGVMGDKDHEGLLAALEPVL
ncbi:MAG TPA: Mur ligase family protein, partial [Nocardioides sp.]